MAKSRLVFAAYLFAICIQGCTSGEDTTEPEEASSAEGPVDGEERSALDSAPPTLGSSARDAAFRDGSADARVDGASPDRGDAAKDANGRDATAEAAPGTRLDAGEGGADRFVFDSGSGADRSVTDAGSERLDSALSTDASTGASDASAVDPVDGRVGDGNAFRDDAGSEVDATELDVQHLDSAPVPIIDAQRLDVVGQSDSPSSEPPDGGPAQPEIDAGPQVDSSVLPGEAGPSDSGFVVADSGVAIVDSGVTIVDGESPPAEDAEAKVALSAGAFHTCALLAGGGVQCWGGNLYGELGELPDAGPDLIVPGLTGAIAVAAGYVDTCALIQGGTVLCWGYDGYGNLGDGAPFTDAASAARNPVVGISGARALATCNDHTCALLSDGTVRCWGDDEDGELGDGLTTSEATPVDVPISRVTAIGAGAHHTCALLQGGTVQCWGSNSRSQLGSSDPSTMFGAPIAFASPATAIAMGDEHSCALLANGTVQCWGDGDEGALGNLHQVDSATPVDVAGLAGVSAIAAGGQHTCALLGDGTVQCWGSNADGELGDSTYVSRGNIAPVVGLANVTSITAGKSFSCALQVGGAAQCWGANDHFQLGDTTYWNSPAPQFVQW